MPWGFRVPRTFLLSLARAVEVRRATAQGVELVRVTFRIADLPPALEGFCLAHVSDIHVGVGPWEPVYAPEAARLVHLENPDVLVNTGDYFQWEPPIDKVSDAIQPFLLDENGRTGPRNLSVLGNHDYFAGPQMVDDLKERLAAQKVCLLTNDAVCVEHDGGSISFAGLTEHEPGFELALEKLLSSDRPRIALIHEPEVSERLPRGAADLILAGHTHGGQITVPGLEPFIVRRFCGSHYVHGMYDVNRMRLYVNRGLGTTGIPFRFRARPEVTIIRLSR